MSWIKRYPNVLLITFGLLSVSLGTLGNYVSGANDLASIVNGVRSFFVALAQLTLNGFESPTKESDVNFLIVSSQLFAVLFVGVGLIRIFSEITEDFGKFRFWWRTKVYRDLDLIIGLGWHGHELAKVHDPQKPGEHLNTIAIAINPSDDAIEECKKSKIIWRRGDFTKAEFIRSLPIQNIAKVFIATGSDEGNVFVLRQLRFAIGRPKTLGGIGSIGALLRLDWFKSESKPRLQCNVAVQSAAEFENMLADDLRSTLDLRTFNFFDSTTRLLLNQRSEAWKFSHEVKSCRLVIVGKGEMFDSALFQWLQHVILEDDIEIKIDVLHADGGYYAADAFVKKYSCYKIHARSEGTGQVPEKCTVIPVDATWLKERVLPEISFHTLPEGPGLQVRWLEFYLESPQSVVSNTIVSVLFQKVEDAVNVAKNIIPTVNFYQRKFASLEHRIGTVAGWVYLNTRDDESFITLQKNLIKMMPDVFAYRDYLGNCSKDTVTNDAIVRAGMRVHAIYSRVDDIDPKNLWFGDPLFEFKGAKPPETTWDRESSLLCGAHAWVKQAIAERLISHIEVSSQTIPTDSLSWDDRLTTALAKVEHRRWCAVHLLRGWLPYVPSLGIKELCQKESLQVQAWYSKFSDRKKIARSQWKHLCLVPFEQLKALDPFVQPDEKEMKKDEKLVKLNNSIIGYATKSN